MIKILNAKKLTREEIFFTSQSTFDKSETVREIIKRVSKGGDAAVKYYTEKFDKVKLDDLKVSKNEIDLAISKVPDKMLQVLKTAAENIREFHSKQLNGGFEINKGDGVIIGQKVIPLAIAGLYVPGGTASYPSTVLMDAIPAVIAGCERVVMVTPPNEKGEISRVILAAAHIAGVSEIYKVGGAQAIAALAYGTETIPKVDKIVGPGNAFVAEAKRQVFGEVSIDMIAGPSEILIIADSTNRPLDVASDLLSQAEHDKMASAVMITDSESFALEVANELEKQIPKLARKEIARASIDDNGKIIVVGSIDEAIDIANEIAPEHLELCVDNPFDYLKKVRNAGSVFLGRNCPEALGDYYAGTNHTLPTSGTARFSSPLSVDDFVKKTQYVYYERDALKRVCKDVEYFALSEGLSAHAKSVTVRFEDEK